MLAHLPLLLAAASPTEVRVPQAAPPPITVAPPGRPNLAGLISNSDYPIEALARDEQGTVGVTLFIDTGGHVTGCRVEESSGFASLDRRTCQVLSQRARFSPARNAAGRPIPDTYTQKISWRMSVASFSPVVDAARRAWMRCLADAARAALRTTGSDEALADRSFPRCTAEESKLLALLPPPVDPNADAAAVARAEVRPALLDLVAQMR